MRFREFKIYENLEPIVPVGTAPTITTSTIASVPTPTVQTTPIEPNQMIGKEPEPVQSPQYANAAHYTNLIKIFRDQEPGATYKNTSAEREKRVPHLRIGSLTQSQVSNIMNNSGFVSNTPDSKQLTVSQKYSPLSFTNNNILYTLVVQDAKVVKKSLTPAGLGLAGKEFTKESLISAAIKAVNSKVKDNDPVLADALVALVNSAENGGNDPLPAELLQHILPEIKTISQDFGEILAPILIMQPNDKVEFPSGNFPMIDVRLPGRNLSVKSLSGSGTSFKTISKLMDRYENEMDLSDKETKKLFNILKQFHPTTGGINTDKIIRAAAAADINEYKDLIKALKTNSINSHNDIVQALDKNYKNIDYSEFLKTFYRVMIAGDWGKPVGLPADGNYYMGKNTKQPEAKAAGKPSYDANPSKGGADILTYVLGVGLLNFVTKGKDAEKYKKMMTDIVNKADAVLGHITINADGTMSLITRPFSDLKFEFQYHAPSHIPGNNLPGFIAVLD
jgi:hypothetical protein